MERGFDHHHVSTLADVHRYFAQGFQRVAGVHLVRATIAKLRRRLGGFAKWPIISGRIFGGDDERIGSAWSSRPAVVQRLAEGGHPAIHHVAGRDDVRSCFRMADGGAG